MFKLLFIFAVIFVALSHAETEPTGMKAGASPQWTAGSLAKVTSLCGVYAPTGNEVYGAILDNSLGQGFIYSDDYAVTGQFYGPVGAMNMDVALSKDGSVVGVAGVGGIFVGAPKSTNFKKVEGIHVISQNIEPFSTQGLAAAGEFSSGRDKANGLVVSADAGATWALYDTGLDSTLYPARYAALPSESTWYVSAGTWPLDSVTSEASTLQKRLSSKLAIHHDGKRQTAAYKQPLRAKNLRSGDSTGYSGAIARTTDGGKTWTQVFDSKGSFYLNGISCADETHCVAVGENDDAAFIVTTSDGVNWSQVFTSPAGISLIAAKALSNTEFWVSGGGQTSRSQLTGYYYHSTDGGATWTLSTLPGYAMDLTFADGVGYSAYLTQSYGSVAVYH